MVDDALANRGVLLDPVAARHVLSALHLPTDIVNLLRIRRASGARIRLGSLGPSGADLPEDGRLLARLGAASPPAPVPDPPGGGPECEWTAEYLPRAVRPGEEFLANVQFRNRGSAAMPAVGEGRVTITSQWFAEAGEIVEGEDVRTPLPAELPPGKVLTVAVRLRAPKAPGSYSLMLKMVHEGVRWLEPPYGPFVIHADAAAGFVPPDHWVLQGTGPHDPAADRERAFDLMREWLVAHVPSTPRLLELGGGAAPMSARLPGQTMQVDGDLMALQLGCMVRRGKPDGVVPFCASFAELPFPNAYFDAIICFGALHYVDDPVGTLAALRGHLRPGGFIGLFCEPVGQIWPGAPGPAVLADLRRGLNPQGFSLGEYARIFAMARLNAAELVIDGVSLKVRLIPKDADA